MEFHTWAGLSAIAGALERKVWLPWSDTFSYYPNIFVLLVSLPGVGKSTALNKAVGLLTELHSREGKLNIIPSQVTEAKFIELMGNAVPFEQGTKIHYQSAGYYWASEASNSLKAVYGDLLPCLTDFYDCPQFWEKATKKDDKLTLRNVCLNLLAGSTFDYLGKMVTDENIMGGFASRLIYVVHRDKLTRNQQFQLGGADDSKARSEYRRALIEDLSQIHNMIGAFTATREFGRAWEEWYPRFEARRQDIQSEKLQSLLVRTNTNAIKCAMLFSAAESNDRELRIEHWDHAITLLEPIEAALPGIFQQTRAQDTKSQGGINAAIEVQFLTKEAISMSELRRNMGEGNFDPRAITNTIEFMLSTGKLYSVGAHGSDMVVKLLSNSND